MQGPLVSIIIPVYKVEPYLRRCLDSIVDQTYTNLEIILVDDGSPDNCPQICDEYAIKDSRIVVIHKENGGLSDARNAGLDICRGEYVSFVDSDDYVHEKYIETLINMAVNENADIAIGEHKKIYGELQQLKTTTADKFSISSQIALNILFQRKNISFIFSWGKLYKKNLFEEVKFPQGKFHEDEFTSYIILSKCKKISYINSILYYYQQRKDSIMSSKHPEDLLEAEEKQFTFLKEKAITDLIPIQADLLCWQCLNMYVSANQETFLQKAQSYSVYLKSNSGFIHFFGLKFFIRFPYIYLLYKRIKGVFFKCSL